MAGSIVVITGSPELSKAIGGYLSAVSGEPGKVFYMTYKQRSSALSQDIFLNADIFILGLIRLYADGPRAEAIPVAERLLNKGKAFLIVSEFCCADELQCKTYWDFASTASLAEAVEAALHVEDASAELKRIQLCFKEFCRTPASHHSSLPPLSGWPQE
ncbi:MAG: hypothetical protein QMD09_12385 [Desulfatibacillaceae bacterium]|nr:hypothetical protein [Desulfatibacillaceae bacterium]